MDIGAIVAVLDPNVESALGEMQTLLRSVCSASTPHRLSAVRYTHCRSVLLAGELRPALPGFLVQCVSIYKFHDFINLYDPKPEARIAFVDNAFAASRSLAESRRTYDVFRDPHF